MKIGKGLRPDKPFTDNPLNFDPQVMRRWIELDEQKAQTVITGNPFV